jgi:hypothetical protein
MIPLKKCSWAEVRSIWASFAPIRRPGTVPWFAAHHAVMLYVHLGKQVQAFVEAFWPMCITLGMLLRPARYSRVATASKTTYFVWFSCAHHAHTPRDSSFYETYYIDVSDHNVQGVKVTRVKPWILRAHLTPFPSQSSLNTLSLVVVSVHDNRLYCGGE